MNVQLRHLHAFIAVAHERSFARAAEFLHVSQPALSQTIIQFEENIGFAVFERTTRSVKLTHSGESLLAKALAAKKSADQVHEEIRRIQIALHSELRVGFMIGTAIEFIPAIVREFERVRPGAILRLKEYDFTDPSAGLKNGEVDCGIFRPPLDMDEIEVTEIANEKCVVCLPTGHRLATKQSVILDDILGEPIIAAPIPGIWRDYWLATEHRNNHPANVVLEVSTVESELQAVATGRGISITAESTARFYARPGVVFRDISNMRNCTIAIGSRNPASKLAADFISVVKQVSAQHALVDRGQFGSETARDDSFERS